MIFQINVHDFPSLDLKRKSPIPGDMRDPDTLTIAGQ
jgi:hypothetical protein